MRRSSSKALSLVSVVLASMLIASVASAGSAPRSLAGAANATLVYAGAADPTYLDVSVPAGAATLWSTMPDMASGYVGILSVELHFPEAGSLKGKRKHVRSAKAQLQNRVGQCVLTCPGTACYAGIAGGAKLKLGSTLRYFGDGWQISKRLADKRYWRIPVMEGEFLCEASTGSTFVSANRASAAHPASHQHDPPTMRTGFDAFCSSSRSADRSASRGAA